MLSMKGEGDGGEEFGQARGGQTQTMMVRRARGWNDRKVTVQIGLLLGRCVGNIS
jgi:hypothetical protein